MQRARQPPACTAVSTNLLLSGVPLNPNPYALAVRSRQPARAARGVAAARRVPAARRLPGARALYVAGRGEGRGTPAVRAPSIAMPGLLYIIQVAKYVLPSSRDPLAAALAAASAVPASIESQRVPGAQCMHATFSLPCGQKVRLCGPSIFCLRAAANHGPFALNLRFACCASGGAAPDN